MIVLLPRSVLHLARTITPAGLLAAPGFASEPGETVSFVVLQRS